MFYTSGGELDNYLDIINDRVLSVVSPLLLVLGSNITYSAKQNKTVKCEPNSEMIVISAKSLRSCRDADLNIVPKNVTFMIGSIYIGVGYLVYDKYCKGKRLGFESVVGCATQRDIFAKEVANILMLNTDYKGCSKVVPDGTSNRFTVMNVLQNVVFRLK